jgi:hypothetical protein
MLTLQRFPWASLSLLLGTYITVGKFLSLSHSWQVWGGAIGGGLLLSILFIHPLTDLGRFLLRWFSSDTMAFLSLVAIAAFAAVLLTWFKVFLPVFLILAAEGLARLDMQAAEFSDLHTFLLLALVTGLGLGIGWGVGQVI